MIAAGRAAFEITLAQLLRARRVLVLAILALGPALLVILVRRLNAGFEFQEFRRELVEGMIPQALVPLIALVLSSGLIQDEIEEQTLTYLLVRPIPKWVVYLAKLLAAQLVTMALLALAVASTALALGWDQPAIQPATWSLEMTRFFSILSLSLLCYNAVFALLGLLVRRPLTIGVAYILLLEGILANIEFAARKVTVMFHARVLMLRWLANDLRDWNIRLDTAPTAPESAFTLLAAAAVAAVLGAILFTAREWRVKTPESA
jgi:ABC-2 type transport system permease protein